jgi:hypothetical protein
MNDVDAQTDVTTEIENETDDLGKEEQKSRFIYLRAKGHSCVELEALQEEFFLLKEGRIRLLGEQIKAIHVEIDKRDLTEVKTGKLLELQLRYFTELKAEHVKVGQRTKIGPKLNSSDIADQLETVLIRYRGGEIDESQAKLEQAVLQSMLKAIEQTELATKLERLEAVVQSRR